MSKSSKKPNKTPVHLSREEFRAWLHRQADERALKFHQLADEDADTKWSAELQCLLTDDELQFIENLRKRT